MKKKLLMSFLCMASIQTIFATISPNPIISRGKSVYTSTGTAPNLVDDLFDGNDFTVSNGSWIAINIGTGYSQTFISWNNPNYSWSDVIDSAGSCNQNVLCPINYTIQKSSNSTNGSNGTWTIIVSVSNNTVTARGHAIDLTGASWVKMNITSGGGTIDEVEVFDVSNNGNDLWFFPGTSISAETYKDFPPIQNYADLINQTYPAYNPMMVRGGIPCISSATFVNDIPSYLNMAKNAKYWAIEMGTNDALGE